MSYEYRRVLKQPRLCQDIFGRLCIGHRESWVLVKKEVKKEVKKVVKQEKNSQNQMKAGFMKYHGSKRSLESQLREIEDHRNDDARRLERRIHAPPHLLPLAVREDLLVMHRHVTAGQAPQLLDEELVLERVETALVIR